MKVLPGNVGVGAQETHAGWTELYDIYLKEAIVTPWGTLSTLRLTTLPGGFAFFTPMLAPEPDGTQGDAAEYRQWNLKRGQVQSDATNGESKFSFAASSVPAEWLAVLDSIDWYDVPFIIRKVNFNPVVANTNEDFTVLFAGLLDSAKQDGKQLQFFCSIGLASLSTVAPRENMHANCRFNWGDDLCTAVRLKLENYKAKTVGSGSTETRVKSAGLTEDAGSAASYGTELINALADAAITTSSEDVGMVNVPVTVDASQNTILFSSGGSIQVNEPFVLSTIGSMPAPLIAGVTYYARAVTDIVSGDFFKVAATPGGAIINITTNGSGVRLSSVNRQGFGVKSSNSGYWSLPNNNDWGTLSNGYWQIPDAQAGLANAALEPYVQFDFGGAKTPRVWRLASVEANRLEDLPRLLTLFSSSDASSWFHESYYELPPVGGQLFTWLHPKARTRRYRRLCIRSKWATTFSPTMLAEVRAYENGRHWWANGQITFGATTATASLRGITRRVMESYSGEVVVPLLPAAPVNGDTFVIERGCPRTFNGCCERLNWENYGGFTDLPNQTIIR